MAYNPSNANGQATMSNSRPVAIASDQSAIPTSGNVAAASTDSGNPVKVGAVYSATPATYTDGQRTDLQAGTRGSLNVQLYVPNSTTTINTSVTNGDAVAVASVASRLGVVSSQFVYNGSTWDRMRGDTTGTYVVGHLAHDAADAGNPIKIGGKAVSALSGVTLVASADRTDNYSDLDGAQLVRMNGAIGDYVNGNASNTDGSSTQVLAAAAAGIKHYITDITITNTSASNIYVELKDNTTVKWTFPVPANGGVTHHFATPIGGTAATAWNFDPSAAATTVYCSVSGFKSKI